MHTIVLATQKGGSGKSTLAIGLARAAIEAGHTVRLIETDQQGTLSNWQTRRNFAEPRVDCIYAAGDLAERLGGAGDVEDVVLDLEREADLGTEAAQCLEARTRAFARGERPEQHARLDERAGLAAMHQLERLEPAPGEQHRAARA